MREYHFCESGKRNDEFRVRFFKSFSAFNDDDESYVFGGAVVLDCFSFSFTSRYSVLPTKMPMYSA